MICKINNNSKSLNNISNSNSLNSNKNNLNILISQKDDEQILNLINFIINSDDIIETKIKLIQKYNKSISNDDLKDIIESKLKNEHKSFMIYKLINKNIV